MNLAGPSKLSKALKGKAYYERILALSHAFRTATFDTARVFLKDAVETLISAQLVVPADAEFAKFAVSA